MADKLIQVSDDGGSNYFTLPGSTGDLTQETEAPEDTVFGQTFQSQEVALITAVVTANAIYKGFAGYLATIKQQGSSTPMTDEAMTQESGQIYAINDAAKQIWDRSVAFVVNDNSVDVTNQVEWFDILFGRIKFLDAHTVTGPVTITGAYFPTTTLVKGRTFNLTQTADTKDTTVFEVAQANGGFRTFDPGLRTVALEIGGVYDPTEGPNFKAAQQARTEYIIELNPDGNGKSVARGIFKLATFGQTGDVGQLEEQTLNYNLNVPNPDDKVLLPFKWQHANDTTLSQAIIRSITAWENQTKVKVRYLPFGTAGDEFDAVVTEMSLTGGLDAMNEFSASYQGDGAPTVV